MSLTLAFESSAKTASVALCSDFVLLGQYFQNNGLTHSTTLMSMAHSLISNLGLNLSDIGNIAVSNGPGSFTGVRIGVSAAKGLAWGLDIPVCPVSSLEAMAFQYPEPDSILCPVMDARRGQVYNALFEAHDNTPSRLCPDRALSLSDLASELCGKRVILIGDGTEIAHDFLCAAGVLCKKAPALLRFQTAFGTALASAGKKNLPAADLEPFYLRPSQAEREKFGLEN